MSFYFRVVGFVSVLLVVAMVKSPTDLKFFFVAGMVIIGGLSLLVALFAWFKPKNLVYGETGHRAESKFEFGTEKRQITEADASSLTGSANPQHQAMTET